MSKTLALDGVPSGYYKPDCEFLRKWAENRGISIEHDGKRAAAPVREERKGNH